MYIEKVLDLWVQLMKNGSKNKCVAFYNFVQYMYTHIPLYKPALYPSLALFAWSQSSLFHLAEGLLSVVNSEVSVGPLGRDGKRAGAMRTALSMKAGALPRNKGTGWSMQLKALNLSNAALLSLRSTAVPQGQERPTATLPHRCRHPSLEQDQWGTPAWPVGQ